MKAKFGLLGRHCLNAIAGYAGEDQWETTSPGCIWHTAFPDSNEMSRKCGGGTFLRGEKPM